uniref:Evasin n=1 Tax=Amblyomma tuberculatum TaxID=48802 RepID=A0A6M2E2L8_9ACAR
MKSLLLSGYLFALVASVAFVGTANTEEALTDDFIENTECACPVQQLENANGTVLRAPGCTYFCGTVSCPIPDDYPCYAVTLETFAQMAPRVEHTCLPGICQNGTCVPSANEEACMKGVYIE